MKGILAGLLSVIVILMVALSGCLQNPTVSDIATELNLTGANVNPDTPEFLSGYDNGVLTTISLSRTNGEKVVWFKRNHYYAGYPGSIEEIRNGIYWSTEKLPNATWIDAEFMVDYNGTVNIAKAYRVMAKNENAFRNSRLGPDSRGI